MGCNRTGAWTTLAIVLAECAVMRAHAAAPQSAPPNSTPTAPAPPSAPAPPARPPAPASSAPSSPGVCDIRIARYEQVRPQGMEVETSPATIAGALAYTHLDIEAEDAPLATVLTRIARTVGVNMVGVYRVREGGAGLDRHAPVTLSLRDVSAIDAIEQVLNAATGMSDSTWQIRGNVVECGTKEQLAEQGRRETRTHDITDLRINIPNFDPKSPTGIAGGGPQKLPKESCADIAQLIMNSVEPTAWEEAPAEDQNPARGLGGATSTSAPPAPTGPRPPTRNLDPKSRADLFVIGRWATMQFRDDRTLVVHAPDFVHRQLAGYGELVPPAPPAPPASSTPGGARPASTPAR